MQRDTLFAQIETAIMALPLRRARIVGVNGVDTSGKTCFAQSLAHFLQARGHHVALVHVDDFHNPRAVRAQGADPVRSYINHAFDLSRLERALLVPAWQVETVDCALTLLDLQADAFTCVRHYVIGRETIVLVEGVLLYRPPVDVYFDLRLFLDIAFDEVLRRAAVRDGSGAVERYAAKYIPVQRWYLKTHRPRERSNWVIDNTDFDNPILVQANDVA